MRRILAAALLGGALFAAAACGGNDNGDGGDTGDTGSTGSPTAPTEASGSLSNEEVCAAGEELGTEFETQYADASQELLDAAASGDEAAMAQAAGNMADVTADMADGMRDIAADAEDPELRTALEDFAAELQGLTEALSSDPAAMENIDTTGLEEATARMEELCPTE